MSAQAVAQEWFHRPEGIAPVRDGVLLLVSELSQGAGGVGIRDEHRVIPEAIATQGLPPDAPGDAPLAGHRLLAGDHQDGSTDEGRRPMR